MTKASDQITEVRRRATVVSVILAAHVGLGIWLDRAPVTSTPLIPFLIPMDLSSEVGTVSGPVGTTAEQTDESVSEATEVQEKAVEDQRPQEESRVPAVAAEPEPLLSESASIDPLESLTAPSQEPSSDDVLKMVEALVATTAVDAAAEATETKTLESIEQAWIASRPGGDGGCELGATIRAKLMIDTAALKELADYPIANRSVSNAIQLWNGEWLGAMTSQGTPALAGVRRAVLATVEEAPEKCLNAQLLGPRLIFVASPDAAPIILVIGSGDWRWADLKQAEEPRFMRWLGLGRSKN